MKTFLVTLLSINVAALLFAPVPSALPGSILFSLSMLLVAFTDYRRTFRPLSLPVAAPVAPAVPADRLPLAA